MIIFVLFLLFSHTVFAVDLSEFSYEIKKYSNEYFPELSNDNFIESITSFEDTFNVNSIFNKLIKSVTGEFKNNISLIFKVIGISILCVVLKNIQSNFRR